MIKFKISSDLGLSNIIRAKDIMNTKVSIEDIHSTINNTAKKLLYSNENYAIIIENDLPVGIVTADDFIKHIAKGTNHATTSIEEIMTVDLINCGPEQSIWDLGDLMHARGISKIPIIDEYDKLVGIVNFLDLLKVFSMKKN